MVGKQWRTLVYLNPGISFDNASIGRVVVDENYRSKWGHDLMREAIHRHCHSFQ
jgi:ElaA protein